MTQNGGYGIFCYLLLLDTNRPIIYLSNPPEVSFDQYGMLESDAIQFAESMGFLLDNLNFRAQPPEVQARLAQELPFFRDQIPRSRRANTGPAPVPGVGGGAPPDTGSVARLLSSF
jgi:hypothetical protein